MKGRAGRDAKVRPAPMSMTASQSDASQRAQPAPDSQPRVFYGWWIVAATFAVQFVTLGTVFYTFSVLLEPLSEALGTDRFTISLALTLQMGCAAALGPWVGQQLAQRSIRAVMLFGVALLATGFAALSQVRSVWQLYGAFGLVVSAGMTLLGPLPCSALLANWFVRRRGTAMGISQFGITIGGTAMVLVASWLVESYGWRTAAGVFALLPVVLVTPVVWTLIVSRPEDRGLRPDGDPPDAPIAEPGSDPGWTLARAVRDRRVWLVALVLGLNFAGFGSVIQVLYSHVTDLQHAPSDAARIVALMTISGAIAKPLFGALADHTSVRGTLWLAIGLQAVGMVLIADAKSLESFLLAAPLYGLGYGAMMPLWGVVLGALFGRRAFSRMMGLMGPMLLPFNLVGLPFATWVHGQAGSYVPAFLVFVALHLLSALVLVVLPVPRREVGAG